METKKKKRKKVPIAFASFAFAQGGGFVWWAAKIDHKVECYEAKVEAVPRLEERVKALTEEINQLEIKVYGR